MAPSLNVFDPSPGPLNPSVPSSSAVVVFLSHERKAVIAMGVAALVSCVLVSVLLLYIIMSAVLSWRKRPEPELPAPFIRKQVAVFITCLFVADLIQSISGVLQLKWAMENQIYEGPICTAQAVTLIVGDLGSTVWSSVIASYTFSSIALGKQWSRRCVYAVVITGWTFVGIMTVIGPAALETPGKGRFFGIAGGWCFITSNYPVQRLGIHYVPLFVAAIVISVLYVLVFLVLRESLRLLHSVQCSPVRLEDILLRERVVVAKRMLWYPAAFLTCIFPISILRLVGMRHDRIPNNAWTFAMVVLFLLGTIDCVIYATTRAMIKPIRHTLPLRKLSADASTGHSEGSHGGHRKSGLSDRSPAEIHRSLDLTGYAPWDTENTKETGGPHFENQIPSAIHITLEQIKEGDGPDDI